VDCSNVIVTRCHHSEKAVHDWLRDSGSYILTAGLYNYLHFYGRNMGMWNVFMACERDGLMLQGGRSSVPSHH
jgi:hypothetical protein